MTEIQSSPILESKWQFPKRHGLRTLTPENRHLVEIRAAKAHKMVLINLVSLAREKGWKPNGYPDILIGTPDFKMSELDRQHMRDLLLHKGLLDFIYDYNTDSHKENISLLFHGNQRNKMFGYLHRTVLGIRREAQDTQMTQQETITQPIPFLVPRTANELIAA